MIPDLPTSMIQVPEGQEWMDKRELLKGFICTLEKQDGLTYEFDAQIWSSLVQEMIVKAKDDIRFIFKNGFEVRVPKNHDPFGKSESGQ